MREKTEGSVAKAFREQSENHQRVLVMWLVSSLSQVNRILFIHLSPTAANGFYSSISEILNDTKIEGSYSASANFYANRLKNFIIKDISHITDGENKGIKNVTHKGQDKYLNHLPLLPLKTCLWAGEWTNKVMRASVLWEVHIICSERRPENLQDSRIWRGNPESIGTPLQKTWDRTQV